MADRQQTTRRFFAIVRKLGLDEQEWRGYVERETGTRSLRDLSDADLLSVVNALDSEQPAEKREKSKKPHVRKVYALWWAMANEGLVKKSHSAVDAFVKRQTGLDNTEWLTSEQANSVIEALKDMQARGGKKQGCFLKQNSIECRR